MNDWKTYEEANRLRIVNHRNPLCKNGGQHNCKFESETRVNTAWAYDDDNWCDAFNYVCLKCGHNIQYVLPDNGQFPINEQLLDEAVKRYPGATSLWTGSFLYWRSKLTAEQNEKAIYEEHKVYPRCPDADAKAIRYYLVQEGRLNNGSFGAINEQNRRLSIERKKEADEVKKRVALAKLTTEEKRLLGLK